MLNKVLPDYLRDAGGAAARLAERLEAGRPRSRPRPGRRSAPATPAQLQRVLTEVAENFLRFQLVAQREAEQEAELGRVPDVVATVPYFDTDIYDLAGLLGSGERIWR